MKMKKIGWRMKAGGSLLAVLALALLPGLSALAQGPGGHGGPGHHGHGDHGKGGHGKITAVNSSSITVTDREGTAKTFTVSSATTVTKDGQAAAASDVAVGLFADIRSADGTAATAIDLHDGPPPGGPGGPGGGDCPDGPGGPGGPPPGQG